MKVKELIEMLLEVDEELDVLIPAVEKFDGYFRSPCPDETGVSELGISELTNETEPAFVIAPHGFFVEEGEDDVIPELN